MIQLTDVPPLPGSRVEPQEAEKILRQLAAVFDSIPTTAPVAPLPNPEAKYRTLIEQLPAVVFMGYLDRGIGEAYVSPRIEEALGFTQAEWLEDPVRWYQQIHPDDRQRWSEEAAQLLMTGNPLRSAYRVLARDGRVLWFQCEVKLVRQPDGHPWFLHGVGFDITDRKRAEEEFRRLLESAPDAMVIADAAGRIVLVNSQTERMFGRPRQELLGQPVELLLPDRHREAHPFRFAGEPQATGTGLELCGVRKDGSEFPIEISLSPLETDEGLLVSGAIRDISERKRVEQRVLDSLREKEALLKEIHHRVKNNLAVISSLFYLQSGYTKDEQAITILRESQDRVRSMAMVHELLYSSQSLASVDFSQYATTLATELLRTYGMPPGRVRLSCSLEEIRMEIDQAVPCGLILNEMLTNALKHAHPGDRQGTIQVILRRREDGRCLLEVADDGVGLPPGLDIAASRSFGLRLIQTLSRQLDGEIEFCNLEAGARARLVFPSGDHG